jgi:hypothetical protein
MSSIVARGCSVKVLGFAIDSCVTGATADQDIWSPLDSQEADSLAGIHVVGHAYLRIIRVERSNFRRWQSYLQSLFFD